MNKKNCNFRNKNSKRWKFIFSDQVEQLPPRNNCSTWSSPPPMQSKKTNRFIYQTPSISTFLIIVLTFTVNFFEISLRNTLNKSSMRHFLVWMFFIDNSETIYSTSKSIWSLYWLFYIKLILDNTNLWLNIIIWNYYEYI